MKKETFKIGDLVKLKENGHVYKVDYFYTSGEKVGLDLIIGSPIGSCKISELELATQADIDVLQADYEFKIGERVIIDNDVSFEGIIEAIDVDDNESYYIKDEGWFDEDNISKINTFKVGDLVKLKKDNGTIGKIVNWYNELLEVNLVIGKHTLLKKGTNLNVDEVELATQAEVDELQKDYEFKIGEEVIYNELKTDIIECIDTECYERMVYCLKIEGWNDTDLISKSNKVYKELFKGDLVKLKNDNKTIGRVCNFESNKVCIELVIGNYITLLQNYLFSELELSNQDEVNNLQKDFEFKIGEKVILVSEENENEINKEYTIKCIDINSTVMNYYLENVGWVRNSKVKKLGWVEKEIKLSEVKEEYFLNKLKEEVKPIEIKEEVKPFKPKKRLLLGAC